MRNKYSGVCYRCKLDVPTLAGHFERHNGGWRVRHHDYIKPGSMTCEQAKLVACRRLLEGAPQQEDSAV